MPVPFLCVFSLSKSVRCVQIWFRLTVWRGRVIWPLLVLHLRPGIMLLGRFGSGLCEKGWTPVTGSNHGNWPNLEVYSFQTTFGIFLTSTAPLYIHFLYFLDCFIPFGVTGRALESLPAAMGEGRVHTLMSLQLTAGPSVSIWWLGKLLKGTLAVKVPWQLPVTTSKTSHVLSTPGFEPRTLRFSTHRLALYSVSWFLLCCFVLWLLVLQ